MIPNQIVKIKRHPRNIKRYERMGYKSNDNGVFYINIKDVSNGSKSMVSYVCDNCHRKNIGIYKNIVVGFNKSGGNFCFYCANTRKEEMEKRNLKRSKTMIKYWTPELKTIKSQKTIGHICSEETKNKISVSISKTMNDPKWQELNRPNNPAFIEFWIKKYKNVNDAEEEFSKWRIKSKQYPSGISKSSQCCFNTIIKELNIPINFNVKFGKEEKIIILNESESQLLNQKHIRLDYFDPTYDICIEFDGEYWHKNRIKKDEIRDNILNKRNIFVVRIREKEWKRNKIKIIDNIKNAYELKMDDMLNKKHRIFS